ncbi:FABP family protein [Amnibacterium flavum]|uniref:Peroxynitrite isomerase n=1 Tax=Amnibacterium flavum TaxID=2173173 RepID=A0A2V1HQU4_9MICO|nr:FABP family protein [Amnibacterium flavum]PVZ94973.1 FABP family protein [Amnibacterium flavum]
MRDLPTDLPSELVPLSWLLGVWEGTGLVEYELGDETVRQPFSQRLSFSHDNQAYLNYSSQSWIPGATDEELPQALAAETGYWRLARKLIEGDPGPGMLPPTAVRPFNTTESVEALRNSSGGFDLNVALVHPTGVSELYLGQVKNGRIDLATDAVMRTEGAKDYSAATRLYGLVEGDLLWAWDIAALGQNLRTHASGRLSRVD